MISTVSNDRIREFLNLNEPVPTRYLIEGWHNGKKGKFECEFVDGVYRTKDGQTFNTLYAKKIKQM